MPATKQMTDKSALKEAVRRWGKGGGVSKRKSPSSQAERDAGHAEVQRLRANPPQRPTTGDAPGDRAGPEWEAWRAANRAHQKAINEAMSKAFHYQYSVGAIFMGFAFEIKGSGDTWEQAFEAARR
jgi:hypothetical protein